MKNKVGTLENIVPTMPDKVPTIKIMVVTLPNMVQTMKNIDGTLKFRVRTLEIKDQRLKDSVTNRPDNAGNLEVGERGNNPDLPRLPASPSLM